MSAPVHESPPKKRGGRGEVASIDSPSPGAGLVSPRTSSSSSGLQPFQRNAMPRSSRKLAHCHCSARWTCTPTRQNCPTTTKTKRDGQTQAGRQEGRQAGRHAGRQAHTRDTGGKEEHARAQGRQRRQLQENDQQENDDGDRLLLPSSFLRALLLSPLLSPRGCMHKHTPHTRTQTSSTLPPPRTPKTTTFPAYPQQKKEKKASAHTRTACCPCCCCCCCCCCCFFFLATRARARSLSLSLKHTASEQSSKRGSKWTDGRTDGRGEARTRALSRCLSRD